MKFYLTVVGLLFLVAVIMNVLDYVLLPYVEPYL